jgi:hypothetical protein
MSTVKAFFKLSSFRTDVTYNYFWSQNVTTFGSNSLINLDLLRHCWLT